MSPRGRLRQIAERSQSLGRMSRRVAYVSSAVKMPVWERPPELAAQRRKPTHFFQADPLLSFKLARSSRSNGAGKETLNV
jgi:hypothetical protein